MSHSATHLQIRVRTRPAAVTLPWAGGDSQLGRDGTRAHDKHQDGAGNNGDGPTAGERNPNAGTPATVTPTPSSGPKSEADALLLDPADDVALDKDALVSAAVVLDILTTRCAALYESPQGAPDVLEATVSALLTAAEVSDIDSPTHVASLLAFASSAEGYERRELGTVLSACNSANDDQALSESENKTDLDHSTTAVAYVDDDGSPAWEPAGSTPSTITGALKTLRNATEDVIRTVQLDIEAEQTTRYRPV